MPWHGSTRGRRGSRSPRREEVTLPEPGHTALDAETLGAALEREHREIDRAIESYLAGSVGDETRTRSLADAMRALRRHIFLEEEFLFPPLRAAGFVAPIFVMLREHGELWRTMDSIGGALAAETADSLVPECRWLLAQLEKHNSKEEPILYPHADKVLGAPASAELRTFLESGRMPENWVCAQAAA